MLLADSYAFSAIVHMMVSAMDHRMSSVNVHICTIALQMNAAWIEWIAATMQA